MIFLLPSPIAVEGIAYNRTIPKLFERSLHYLPAVFVPLRRPQCDGLYWLQTIQQTGLVQLQNPAISVVLAVGQVDEWIHDDEAHGKGDVVHRTGCPAQ